MLFFSTLQIYLEQLTWKFVIKKHMYIFKLKATRHSKFFFMHQVLGPIILGSFVSFNEQLHHVKLIN